MNPTGTPAPSPTYAFPLRALGRWATENLSVSRAADDSILAEFRLECSTCSNIAFHVVYHVRLAPPSEGWRILALDCAPAPGDVNFSEQCEASADEARLLAAMHSEQPLLGKPLADALTWVPQTTPDGCLCAETARAHKWRAVLQTLHHALNSSP